MVLIFLAGKSGGREMELSVRCYLMKDSHVADVAFLTATTQEDCVAQAKEVFAEKRIEKGVEGFEVWDGPSSLYQFPER